MVRNVVILGGSYAGSRAADLLAKTLPSTHRVVLIDRQSHFNHLYIFPRFGVLPGHSQKAFIPFTNLLASSAAPPPSTLPFPADASTTPASVHAASTAKSVFVNASAVEIGEGYVEVDRDLDRAWGVERGVEGLADELERMGLSGGRRRVEWDYLVYALGCTLPEPLLSPARTKTDGIAFLQAQQTRIAAASNILIIGGGALGIQYATDIADLYLTPSHASLRPPGSYAGPKKITLVHSRDRFLPLYDEKMHVEVMRRLEELGVEVILGERVVLPSEEELVEGKERGGLRRMKLSSGREVEYDLLMRCTGQQPNSQLLEGFLPEAVNAQGFVEVKKTMLVALPEGTKPRENVFVCGDVANAGVIKAGHTGWNQAEVVVQNIMCSIEAARDDERPQLVDYQKSPPQIKVTLGLTHSVSELLPNDGGDKAVVKTSEGGPVDGHWSLVWSRMGVDSSDQSI